MILKNEDSLDDLQSVIVSEKKILKDLFKQRKVPYIFQAKGVQFKTEDHVDLKGLYLSTPSAAKGLIVYSYGNAGQIFENLQEARIFLDLGYDIFFYDYRGYGWKEKTKQRNKKNKVNVTEKGLYLDAEAAYDAAKKTYHELRGKEVNPLSMIAVGHSLGGGVTSYLASVKEFGGVVIMSSFTSIGEVKIAKNYFLKGNWLKKSFRTIDHMKEIKAPVLLLHSAYDTMIAPSHSENLAKKALEEGKDCLIEILPDEFGKNEDAHSDVPKILRRSKKLNPFFKKNIGEGGF